MSRALLRFAAILTVLLVTIFSRQLFPDFTAPIENTLSDWRTRAAIQYSDWQAHSAKLDRYEQRLVLIDIDEKSVAEQGPWPWPRDKVAALIANLVDHYGVAGVALDIVFPEARNQDKILAEQMQRPEITGAVVYDLQDRRLPELSGRLPESYPIQLAVNAPRFSGIPVTSNHAAIMPARVGHITPIYDADGSIRHVPPILCQRNATVMCRPLLEIQAFAALMENPNFKLQAGTGLFAASWELLIQDGPEAVVATIPLNKDGAIVVPYRHSQHDWLAISASDILERRSSSKALKGTIALIGSTALGMADVIVTPSNPEASGMIAHAEVLSALFDEGFIFEPRWVSLLVFIILLPLVLVLEFAMRRIKRPAVLTLFYPSWLAFAWSGSMLIAMVCFIQWKWQIPLTPLFLFPPLMILTAILFALHRSNIERVGVFGLLATYLPKEVAKRLTTTEGGSKKPNTALDATRREITVLFADIRGFTGLVENARPEVVAILMHKIFSEMAAAVVNHHGTIDKFIGDAVMAFWNAPEDDPEHALHAFAAAKEMHQRIVHLDTFCRSLGIEPVSVGIGIETGLALVGNFGSEHRRTYTALGEAVVLASRIEGLSAQYQAHILIGARCASFLPQAGLRHLGSATIRGRLQSVDVFAPKED
ncbi:CHASE2 domain-containing protein [Undibacterium fentianense]|uniref:Adenylate/guanylate cyclase domain-containing protein n=1 Tax=Undibacterium fentianense TaxID=2828728 RepID=A0A941E5L4_9BURK|nr:adenylate/guanylate cyclase domain-containing protein [Undibacterium fentianense]MBR7801492.1 adenylate/guanylate cyclase domain-containing protein [Undibacterium fentianense]